MIDLFWCIEYIASYLECILCSVFCENFISSSESKINHRRILVSIIASFFMILVNKIELFSIITLIIGLIILSISQIIIYRREYVKLIFCSIFFLLIIMVIDNIVVSVISYTSSIPSSEIYQETSIFRTLSIICSKCLLAIVAITTNKFFSKKKSLSRNYLLTLFTITILMFALIASLTFIDIKNDTVNTYISIIFFAIMLILLAVIFFGTFKLAEHYEEQQQLQLVKLKNRMLEQSMAETEKTFELWRESMHDYKHNIVNLITLADNNNIEGIKHYLVQEESLLNKKLFYYKTGNDTVDAILYIKQQSAEKMNITFIIDADIPSDCSVKSEDFASLLGNILDNAIEASLEEDNPYVEIRLKPSDQGFWIIVTNKYTKSNHLFTSTKDNKVFHGIGLKSVKHTVKKYNGILNINISDDSFSVKIIIPT